MNTYICHPAHIAVLALCAVKYECVFPDWVGANRIISVRRIAEELMRTNILGAKKRCPHYANNSRGPVEITDDALVMAAANLAEAYFSSSPFLFLGTTDILKMSQGYEYQCQMLDDWLTSPACRQIRMIIDHAITELPGYDKAMRYYNGIPSHAQGTADPAWAAQYPNRSY